MAYKVFVSTGYACETFYCEREMQAHELFNMAVDSKNYTYVSLSEIKTVDSLKREWVEVEEQCVKD